MLLCQHLLTEFHVICVSPTTVLNGGRCACVGCNYHYNNLTGPTAVDKDGPSQHRSAQNLHSIV